MQEQLIEDRAGLQAAVLLLLQHATAPIVWFDRDGHDLGWTAIALHDALEAYWQQRGSRSLRLLLHDDDYLAQHCPRLLRLFELNGHRVQVRLTAAADRSRQAGMLVAGDWVLRRLHFDYSRAVLAEDETEAQRQLHFFDDLWQNAKLSSSGRRLSI